MKKVLLILGLIGFVFGQSYAQVCSGTPTPGTASGPATICAGTPFTLTLTGYDTGTGITFQWQSSTDGVTFTDESGATSDMFTTSASDTMYYQCVVTCTSSGMTATSNVVAVNAAFYFCYCTSGLQASYSPCISNVKINTLDNSSTVCAFPAYTFYDPSITTTTLTQGSIYPISVTTDGDNILSVWIDYDHSGTFDASEWTQIATTTTAGSPSTVTINVPSSSLTGLTGMRVRARGTGNPNGAFDACTSFGSGETEDYIINIVPGVPCTGAPTAGNTVSSSMSVCSGVNFDLNIDNPPVGASGISYQWQSSTDGVTYTDMTGDTSQFLTTSQTTATYYQLVVTCANSGMSTTSTPVMVNMNSFFLCYCSDSYAMYSGDTKIDSVEVDGIITGTDPYTCETYTDYTSVTGIDLQIFGPNDVRVRNGSCSGYHYGAYVSVYIDYNQNGDYSDAGELAASYGQTTALNSIPVMNVTPPLSAIPGLTGMRIVFSEGSSAPPPCGTYYYGETEDYVVNLIPAPPCSGMPTAGSASTTAPNICLGDIATLGISGSTIASDMNYQWQESTDGVTFTDITGATTFYYDVSPTDTMQYQVVVTCPTSGMSAVSAPVTVNLNPFYMCYCNDNLYAYEYPCIENVTVNTLDNSHSGCTMPSWTYFPPVGTATTDLAELTNYTMSVTDDGSAIVSVWIDYDHSGTFDASEWTQVTTHSASFTPSSVVINIPNTALLGLTGMRVRSTYYYDSNGATDACSYFYGGETEDYVVNILTAPPCTNPPVGGAVSGPATDSVGNTGTYTLSGFNGDDLQWYVSFDGGATYSILTGETDSTLTYTYNSAQDPTFMVVASSPGCISDSSSTFTTNIITNDNVCEAFPLMIGTNGPYDLTGFSVEAGEPAPPALGCSTPLGWCNSNLQGSMWFTIVAPPSGRISVQSPGFDTQLALWKVDSCGNMLTGGATLLAANDDDPDAATHGGVTFSSYVSTDNFCLTPGETYYVQLDPYFSPSTTTVVVTDLGAPSSPVVNVPDSIFCATVTLDAGPGSAFQWSSGDTTQTATFSSDGIVWVTVTDSVGCRGTDSATITNNAPLAGFTSNQVSIGIFNFTNTSTPPSSEVSATYSWTFGDGGTSSVENPSHIYTANGSYIVTLTITNACGTDAITQVIVVNGVGVAELNTDNTVKVYPNPAVEVLNITSGTNITGIELVDAAGQRVINNTNLNTTQHQVNLDQLARGMYTVTVHTTVGVSRSRIAVVR